jgi:hypothetical protein
MNDLTSVFERLSRSSFRQRFRLHGSELAYLRSKGIEVVLEHAAGFVEVGYSLRSTDRNMLGWGMAATEAT